MDNGTYVALSRLVAQTRAMDVTAANLANVTTPGYRAERVLFSDWLGRQKGAPTITYTQDRATYRDVQGGQLSHTGNSLDLAITGEGYFTVAAPGGARLTRAGHFALAKDGTVVDEQGDALLDNVGKKLQLSPADTTITVASDGGLSSENGAIGHIGIVTTADPNKLQAEGGRLLNATATTTQQNTAPQVLQGVVEQSNVNAVGETTRMMNDLRNFQMVAQFVQSEADRQKSAIDTILQQRS